MSSQKENVPMSCGGDLSLADIEKSGYLRKLKTMRKKFFVLRSESNAGPSRLEYYDNEKKFRLGGEPKRTVLLSACFNINKKSDAKHKHAIALYTKDDCFSLVAEDDDSQNEWLRALLEQQRVGGDGKPIPAFEHVWQVTVKPKGLGSSKSLSGVYRLCLTTTTISLFRMNCEDDGLQFSLSAIRRCGHSDCFFFMEVGRQSVTGPGELWMQVEDTVIAQSIHEASLEAMRSVRQQEEMRPRSHSSTMSVGPNSDSKPGTSGRRQANTLGPSWRTRCDSMPVPNRQAPGRGSRSRGTSEGEDGQQELAIASSSSPVSNFTNPFMRPRTCSEGGGMGHTAVPRSRSRRLVFASSALLSCVNLLLKFGTKLRPRTSSEGEKGLKAPDSPTKTRGRFSIPLTSRGSHSGGPIRPLSVHRMVAQPISNSPPIPNSPLSESPQGYMDERYSSDGHTSDDHYFSRFGTSGRSRTPESPSHVSIREEMHEGTDEYMSMSPSGSSKAIHVHPHSPRLSHPFLQVPSLMHQRRASSPSLSLSPSTSPSNNTPSGGNTPNGGSNTYHSHHHHHLLQMPIPTAHQQLDNTTHGGSHSHHSSPGGGSNSHHSSPSGGSSSHHSPSGGGNSYHAYHNLQVPIPILLHQQYHHHHHYHNMLHASSYSCASSAESSPRSLSPLVGDEPDSYMSMTPGNRSRPGSASLVTGSPASHITSPANHRLGSSSGLKPPTNEDEGYMMMGPSPGSKRATPITITPQAGSATNEPSTYMLMNPSASHSPVSTPRNLSCAPSPPTVGGGGDATNSMRVPDVRHRYSADHRDANELMVMQAMHQRSHSEPVIDTYCNMEFEAKKRGSDSHNDNNNVEKAAPQQRHSVTSPEPRYINVLYHEKTLELDRNVQVMVDAPDSEGKGEGAGEGVVKDESDVVENGSRENAINGEYMNMNFGRGCGKSGVDLSKRQVPPLLMDAPTLPNKDNHDYINVEMGTKDVVKTSPRHTPTSPASPSWLKRPVAEQLIRKSLEDLTISQLGNMNIPFQGSANSLTGVCSNRSNDPMSPGDMSSHHSSRRSSQSSLSGEKELNYIDVDIGQPTTDITGSSTPTLKEKRSRSPFRRHPNDENQCDQVNYSTIDFTKSEGLRSVTTNLRDNRF